MEPRPDLMAAITRTLTKHPSGSSFEKLLWFVLRNNDISLSLKDFDHTVRYMQTEKLIYLGDSNRYYLC